MVDDVEFKPVVGPGALLHEVVEAGERPQVEPGQLLLRNEVPVGIKVGDVAEDEPRGVADFAVDLGKLL